MRKKKSHRSAGGDTGEGGGTRRAGGETFLHVARRIQLKVELKSLGWFNTGSVEHKSGEGGRGGVGCPAVSKTRTRGEGV